MPGGARHIAIAAVHGGRNSPLLPNQPQQLPCRHLAAHLPSFQEIVGQIALVAMKFHDLLLDGVLGDQPVDGDGALLADAVGAVGGLVFHGGVPPGACRT